MPQFISAKDSAFEQTLFLAALFVLIAAMIDVVYVALASHLMPKLKRGNKNMDTAGKVTTASAFFFLSGYAVSTD